MLGVEFGLADGFYDNLQIKMASHLKMELKSLSFVWIYYKNAGYDDLQMQFEQVAVPLAVGAFGLYWYGFGLPLGQPEAPCPFGYL